MKDLNQFINEKLSKKDLDNIKEQVRIAMINGYLRSENDEKFGISRENIFDTISDASEDEIKQIISELEKDGVKFRYEKDTDWKKDHKDWKDIYND